MPDALVEMIDADIHVYEPASMWGYVDKQFRDRVQTGIETNALVTGEHASGQVAVRISDRHRQDLSGEVSVQGGPRSPSVALERERVHVLTTDLPPICQNLGDAELGPQLAVDLPEKVRAEGTNTPPGV